VAKTPANDGVTIDVHVIPRARKSEVAGTRGEALLVRLNAQPVDGAANSELIELLATALGLSKRQVSIVSGERSRAKRVRIQGRTAADVERLLKPVP
jgi:uncharacterized protein (TIGR00251 family)